VGTARSFCAELRSAIVSNIASFSRRDIGLADRRAAAVAVAVLPDDQGNACFILTRRTSKVGSHKGQWALPGGRFEDGEDAHAAALREMHEEVGVEPGAVEVLGSLDDYATRSGYVITPVVIWCGLDTTLVADPYEVAEVYRVPVADLEKSDVPHVREIPESDQPVISIPLLGANIHAPTAAVLYQFSEVGLGGRDTRVSHFEQPVFAWR